jgi:uncharacterized protein YndB with AHSA1/START domain
MNPVPELTITRTFNAPRALVFAAWTEAEHLKHWWCPKGLTLLSCTIDLRPGGVFRYGMRNPDGVEMWGKWVFADVIAPERITFSSYFTDAEAGITTSPFGPDWPQELVSSVTFAEHDGRTTITLRGIPRNATAAELKAFTDAVANMQQGWTGTLNVLDEHLTKLQTPGAQK